MDHLSAFVAQIRYALGIPGCSIAKLLYRSVFSMHSTVRTRPHLLIAAFFVVSIGLWTAETFALNWMAGIGASPLWLIRFLGSVQYASLSAIAFWIGFRSGGTSRWTWIVPVIMLLLYCMGSGMSSLWRMGGFTGGISSGQDSFWAMIHFVFWSSFKSLTVAAIASWIMQCSFGFVLATSGSTVKWNPLSIRVVMVCVAMMAVLLAIDGRVSQASPIPGMNSNIGQVFFGLVYLLHPTVEVCGFFGLAWLIAVRTSRRWMGGLFLAGWFLANAGLITSFLLFVLPAIAAENSSSSAVSFATPSVLELALEFLLRFSLYLAIIGVFRVCGYSMMAASTSNQAIEPSSNEPQ
jgi:hypothetical protein